MPFPAARFSAVNRPVPQDNGRGLRLTVPGNDEPPFNPLP